MGLGWRRWCAVTCEWKMEYLVPVQKCGPPAVGPTLKIKNCERYRLWSSREGSSIP
jgi:hypothetical protein